MSFCSWIKAIVLGLSLSVIVSTNVLSANLETCPSELEECKNIVIECSHQNDELVKEIHKLKEDKEDSLFFMPLWFWRGLGIGIITGGLLI